MADLPVNYVDAILASGMNGKRRVKLTELENGVYEVEDVTEYDQEGSSYGAVQVNATNGAINGKLEQILVIDDRESAVAVTEDKIPVGCKAFAALNNDLTANSTPFIYDYQNGQYGYNTDPARGADTFHPFKSAPVLIDSYAYSSSTYGEYKTATFDVKNYSSNWTDLTVDDFVVPYAPVTISSGFQYGSTVLLYPSYDNTTGIFTLKIWNRVNYGTGANIAATATFNVYLW